MNALRKVMLGIACTGLFCIATGCGGDKGSGGPLPTEMDLATKKVDAMKRLAANMAKDADGAESRAALEDFRNTPIDPKKSPAQAKEIVDIYTKSIQGKHRGFVAGEIQMEINSVQAVLKQGSK